MAFAINVLKLGSANVCAMVISLAAVPIITRLYSPGDYGTFGVFLGITTVLAPVVNLRLNAALMLPDREKDATNLFVMAMGSALIVASLVSLLMAILSWLDRWPEIWLTPGGGGWVWAVPAALCVQGVFQAVNFWAIRQRQYGRSGVARITESVFDRSFVVASGLIGALGSLGLIFGRILGPGAALVYLIKAVDWQRIVSHYKLSQMWLLLKRYRQFPLIGTWASVAGAGARLSPVFVLPIFFPPSVVGFYVLCFQVVNLPNLMLGDAVTKAYFQKASRERLNPKLLARETIQLFGCSLYVVLPPTIFVCVFGPDLFAVVFGEQWRTAGGYAQILAPVATLGFLHKFLSSLFDVFERQAPRLAFDVARAVLLIMGIAIGALTFHSPRAALAGILIATVVSYFAGYYYLFRLIHINWSDLLRGVSKNILVLFPLFVGIVLLYYVQRWHGSLALLLFGTSLILQGAVLFTVEKTLIKSVWTLFLKMRDQE